MTKLYFNYYGEQIVPTDFIAGGSTLKIYLECDDGTSVSLGELFGSFRGGSATLCCDRLPDGEYTLLVHKDTKSTIAARLSVAAGIITLPTDTDGYLRLMRAAVNCRKRCTELEKRILKLEESVYGTYLF